MLLILLVLFKMFAIRKFFCRSQLRLFNVFFFVLSFHINLLIVKDYILAPIILFPTVMLVQEESERLGEVLAF